MNKALKKLRNMSGQKTKPTQHSAPWCRSRLSSTAPNPVQPHVVQRLQRQIVEHLKISGQGASGPRQAKCKQVQSGTLTDCDRCERCGDCRCPAGPDHLQMCGPEKQTGKRHVQARGRLELSERFCMFCLFIPCR